MTKKYTIKQTPTGNTIIQLDLGDRMISIPMDESNSDYQAYLRWLENPDAEENGTIS